MFDKRPRSLISYHTPLGPDARIFMCGLPGVYIDKDGSLGLSESLLHQELLCLKKSNVEVLIGLIEDKELGSFAYDDLTDYAAKLGLAIERFDIPDYGAPLERQDPVWRALRSDIATFMRRERNITFHCMGGIGRSGMMAGSLLVYLGMSPHNALKTIRIGQPAALESEAQRAYLLQHH